MGKQDAPRTAAEPLAAQYARRLVNATRLALLAGLALGLVGMAGQLAGLPLVSSTLGPAGYLLLAHPEHETAKLGNACFGQLAAIGSGLLALAATGIVFSPPGHTLSRAAASALGVGLTMLALELVRSRHAPAASTVLLITAGLAALPTGLAALGLGIAGLLAVVAGLSRVPPMRRRRSQPAAEEVVSVVARAPNRRPGRTAAEPAARRRLLRLVQPLHMAVLGSMVVGVIGIGEWLSGLPLISSSLGPTACVFFVHPEHMAERLPNAAIAHTTAIAAGLIALAVTGSIGQPTPGAYVSALAPALALALTVLAMDLADSNHAPAGSTAVLVGGGVAGPIWPLAGLIVGLAALLGFATLQKAILSSRSPLAASG